MDVKKNAKLDRYLIAEQPGMAVFLTGLLFSFFCGFTFKSYFSAARVFTQVERAASHIHKGVKVQFSSAQLSLADGIWPRLAVIISDVRMESENKCWAAPVLDVDELSLPLSMWRLLRHESPVLAIEANAVTLNLREALQDCGSTDNAAKLETAKDTKAPVAAAVVLSPSEKEIKYQNDLRSLTVNDFKIVTEKYPHFSSELMQFTVSVKSFEPKVVEIRAKTHLLKDQQVGDYLSHANLFVQYQESPQIKVQSHFFGNWREGHYSLIANYTVEDQRLALEADLKHIPLSQILLLMKKYNFAAQDLNGRQAWISTKATMVSEVSQLRQSPLEIRDLRLEGDLGELKSDQITLSTLDPLRYSPIVVDIKKLDIVKLLLLLNRPSTSTMLAGLGSFSGRAEIISDKNIKLRGEHQGLEFVFSNKGQRELQVIERMVGGAEFVAEKWNFTVNRVEPQDGTFLGVVKVKADRDFQNLEIKTRVDEMTFSRGVQKLMTGGGSIGSLSLDVDAQVRSNQLSYLKGLARLDEMDIEGLHFGKSRATLDWSHGDVVLNTQVKSVQIAPNSGVGSVLKDLTLPSWWQEEGLAMTSLTGVFSTKKLQDFSWKNVQGQVGKTGRFMTEGAWDQTGQLRGAVFNRDGKTHRKWFIEGSRVNPEFVVEISNNKSLRK